MTKVTTRAKFNRNAMMSMATLTDDGMPDARPFYVFCSLPNGRPFASFSPDGDNYISVVNAPTCETHRDFKAFVKERWEVDKSRDIDV